MNWIEKVRHLKKLEEEDEKNGYKSEYLIDINYDESRWKSGEIESIIRPYLWIPESYVRFIKEFDNLGLSFVVFFGSEDLNGIPLVKELQYWREEGLSEDYFPFGKDAGGSIFTFNKNSEVLRFDAHDYELKIPEKIADSFEEFVGECLMGKRYAEFSFIEGDGYYDLLKDLGWT